MKTQILFMSIITRECFWKISIKFINSFHKYLPTFSALDAITGIWDASIKIIIVIKKSLPSWNLYCSWYLSLGFLKSISWIWIQIIYLVVDVLESIIVGNWIRAMKATNRCIVMSNTMVRGCYLVLHRNSEK